MKKRIGTPQTVMFQLCAVHISNAATQSQSGFKLPNLRFRKCTASRPDQCKLNFVHGV